MENEMETILDYYRDCVRTTDYYGLCLFIPY